MPSRRAHQLKTEDFAAGKHALLTFTVTDAKSGEPVTDLEPYLGAPAHMLLVRARSDRRGPRASRGAAPAGPTVSFHPL